MKKADLVSEVWTKTGFAKKDVELIVDTMLDSVSEALARGEKVQFVGFGSFEARPRAARNCINPHNGEMVHVKETRQPVFRPGRVLKDVVASSIKK